MNPVLRWIGSIALHWFYREVRVENASRIPRDGPLLVAMNHPNALVDALIAATVVPRPLRLTAKASLGNTLPGALLLRIVGIIPLRRASDEGGKADPMRNRDAFERMVDELAARGAILVFPEGKSHNEPELGPLKTGLARAALRARADGVRGVRILPVGTTFERKEEPGTAVLVRVGDPIDMDAWDGDDPHALTDELARRLRAVSLLGHFSLPDVEVRRGPLVRALAWWGRIMHRIPVTLARRMAIARSHDEGEPAMYTMTFGLALTFASYVIQGTIVGWLLGWPIALLWIAALIVGAYWAAYADHPAPSPVTAAVG